MVTNNPFDDVSISLRYETWYHTTGKKAVFKEKSLIKTLLDYFPDARTILEVGCGTGFFLNWFKTIGLKPTGLDCSRAMLLVAQNNHQLPSIQGDAMTLPFEANTFDLTTFITSLAFISDPKKSLVEALRVSAQGLILGVINKNSLLGWHYFLQGGLIWKAAKFLTLTQLLRILKDILPENHRIIWKTTLFPLLKGSAKFPWGGFIGLAVKLNPK